MSLPSRAKDNSVKNREVETQLQSRNKELRCPQILETLKWKKYIYI